MQRKVVVPGELVTEEKKRIGSHVFIRDGKIFSDVLGLVDETEETASVVPLEGKYMPKQHDIIVGVVTSEKFGGYTIDINSVWESYLSNDKIRERLRRGNIISAKVVDVNELHEAVLDNIRVFYGGELLDISPVKVPRVIGKNGSMLDVLRKGTGSSLIVGRNGWIWAKGTNSLLLKKSLKKIEDEAHKSNLTTKMAEFLTKESGQKVDVNVEKETKDVEEEMK